MHFSTITLNSFITIRSTNHKSIQAFLFLLVLMFCVVSARAVPAYPHPIEFTQPDGTTLTIRLMGDERVNWAETLDGYTILVTKEGYYEYAIKDEHGDLVFSGIRVSEPEKRTPEESAFLEDIPKALFFSDRQLEMMQSVWKMRDDAKSRVFPTIGEASLVCILMQTPDKPFTKTQEEFDALFNQLNYTIGGATGSVRDYYLENSYGQFDLTVDVVGPYTAQHNMAHYGSTWNGARQLATEAVHLANPDVNYADYDNTGNGVVDGFYMIFAGYGEEAGGGPSTIWSHAWSIEPVQLDGVWLYRYACSPELRGNSGTNITRIGVIGHELGHVFGAPDYYDTDGSGSGGQFSGTGAWDMMAGGTWNNGGATPAHHNAYTKVYTYNWAEATILNQPGNVTLENAAENSNSFFRINTNTPGEYYLLENRHHIGFDASIPGQGMIIYHVHKEVATSGNSVNVGHPQKMYPVSAGANTDPFGPPASYGNISSAETPFPGSTNQTYFSDLSTPSMLSWAGEETYKPLSNITRHFANQTVTFDFLEDAMLFNDWLHWDNGMHETSVGLGSGGVYQIAARFDPEDLLAYQVFDIAAIRLFVGNPPTNAAIKVWQGNSQENLQEIAHQAFSPPSASWIEIVFDEAVDFDPDIELWIGAEYHDPGQGVFSASLDNQTNHDGKGNMIRLDIDDNESWQPLTNFNINGDWNIQARLIEAADNSDLYHYNITFVVTDEFDSIIEDAVITLGSVENETGNYEFTDIPMGVHSWKAERLCYLVSEGEIDLTYHTTIEAELFIDNMAGDANGDGLVNVLDIILMADHWIYGNTEESFCPYNADLDQNGVINIMDIITTANVIVYGDMVPFPDLESENATIYLNPNGISINSDGTLAGIQFELDELENSGLELNLELNGFELIYEQTGESMKALVFSFDNTPFPSGKFELVSFSEALTRVEWNTGLIGNLNAWEVPFYVYNELITSVDGVFEDDIKVFPNPVKNMLYVELYNANEALLTLTNMHGQIIKTMAISELGQHQLQINLGGYNPGVYILEIKRADASLIRKIILN